MIFQALCGFLPFLDAISDSVTNLHSSIAFEDPSYSGQYISGLNNDTDEEAKSIRVIEDDSDDALGWQLWTLDLLDTSHVHVDLVFPCACHTHTAKCWQQTQLSTTVAYESHLQEQEQPWAWQLAAEAGGDARGVPDVRRGGGHAAGVPAPDPRHRHHAVPADAGAGHGVRAQQLGRADGRRRSGGGDHLRRPRLRPRGQAARAGGHVRHQRRPHRLLPDRGSGDHGGAEPERRRADDGRARGGDVRAGVRRVGRVRLGVGRAVLGGAGRGHPVRGAGGRRGAGIRARLCADAVLPAHAALAQARRLRVLRRLDLVLTRALTRDVTRTPPAAPGEPTAAI